MKRVFLFWGLLAIFVFVVSGTLFAKGHLDRNDGSVGFQKNTDPLSYKFSKMEMLKKASNDRIKMHDQIAQGCSMPRSEGVTLWNYPNFFSGGTMWVGTNGNAVIFNNGLNLSFANAADISHPTVPDVTLLDWVYKGIFFGDTAYLLETDSVDIWDVSDPTNPTNMNWWWDCNSPGYYDLAIKQTADGDLAFLASGANGIAVMDLNTGLVQWPTVFNTGLNNDSLQLVGNYLLSYSPSSPAIAVFDVTKPLEPILVQTVPLLAAYSQVIYSSPYLYCINYNSGAARQLDVFSWLSPTGPLGVAPVNAANFVLATTDPAHPQEQITHCEKDGDYLYVSGTYGGAYVVDVSVPTSPTLYKFFPDNILVGGNGHQNNYSLWITSANGVHIVADNAGITSFNLDSERTGYYIATSELWGWWSKDGLVGSVDGSRLLANAYYEGSVLLDSDLLRLGFWELPTYNSYALSSNFSLDGSKAFVCWEDDSSTGDAGQSGVAILDISNDQMTLIKNYIPDPLTHDWVPYYAVPVNIGAENYLLINEFQSSTGKIRVEIVNITVPSSPSSVSIAIPSGTFSNINKPSISEGYLNGKVYAIVPVDSNGIRTIEITNPIAPVGKVTLNLGGKSAKEIAIESNNNEWVGFVATNDTTHGLYVIDLNNPSSAVTTKVIGYGNLAEQYSQVALIQVGDPKPQVIATFESSTGGELYDASSPVTPIGIKKIYDYAAYMGLDNTRCIIPAPISETEAYLFTSSYLGITPWYNVPDYIYPNIANAYVDPAPPGNVIASPVKLTAEGVTDTSPGTIRRVRFYAEDPCSGYDYKLGDAVAPTEPGGTTYQIDFDPATFNWAQIYPPYPVTFDFYAVATDYGYNSIWYLMGTYTIMPLLLTLSPDSLPDGQFRTIYNQTITASGGTAPYTFSITEGSLPSGYTLNSTTGVIYGMTMNYGVYNFRVTATDANGATGYRDYTIKVCPNITISPASLPSGTLGVYYEQVITAGGGNAPYNYNVIAGAPPAGFSINFTTGVLSGTPNGSGNYVFTISATDSNGCSGTRQYSLTISQSIPPEVAPGNSLSNALIFSEDKKVISWPAEPSSAGYRLYRGTLATLPYLQNANVDSCKRYDGQQTSVDVDTDDPSTESGSLYFYLVTGYNQGGEGPAGNSRILNSSGNCSGSQEFNPQWQGVHSLSPKDMYWSGSCSYNGKIYLFGGNENDSETTTTYIYDVATDEWSQGANMPTGRYLCTSVEVGGKIYVMGGRQLTASTNPVNVNECYDPATNTWETKAVMPNAIRGHSSVSANGKIYVLGGNTGSYTDAVKIYDPSINSWSSGPTMPIKEGYGGAVYSSSTNSIYWVGGVKSSTASESNYIGKVYTLNLSSNTWDSGISMPYKTAYFGIAIDNSKIYITGGTFWDTSSSQDTSFPAAMIFDISSGNFEAGLIEYPSPLSRAYCIANFVNGKLFIMQGQGNRLVDEYNPSTQQWYEPNSPINNGTGKVELTGAFGSAINGEFYVVGGAGSDVNPYVYKYNPSTNQWSVKTGTDSNPTFYCTGGVWNNKLVIYGGFDLSQNPVPQAKIYDPIAETFTPIGGTNPHHANFSAGVVLNDKLYLFGGDDGSNLVNYLSILDLNSGLWSSGANLPIAMENMAVVAYNGKIYLFGGYDGVDPDYLNDVTYIYDPLTNSYSTGASLPVPVDGAKSFVYGDKIVVDSGYNLWYNDLLGGLSGGLKASMQVYDPQTNSFVGTFPSPFGKRNHSGDVIGTKYYSVMGEDDYYPVSRLDIAQCN